MPELLDIATRVAGWANDGEQVEAYVVQYADSSIDFLVRFWHASDILSGFTVTDEVGRAINRSLKANGIVIAFPQRDVHFQPGQPVRITLEQSPPSGSE